MTALQELFRNFGSLFRWWVIVAPWEQAVRVRLGKHVVLLEAGCHLRIPFADRIFRQSVRRRFTGVPTQTVTTKDGKTVTVGGGLAYSIVDVLRLYSTLHDAEDVIQTEANAAVARFVSAHDLTDCLPPSIEAHVGAHMDLEQYGLEAGDFCVTDFAVARTYRVIQGQPKDWKHGQWLDMERDTERPAP